jgi:hypothetical protein
MVIGNDKLVLLSNTTYTCAKGLQRYAKDSRARLAAISSASYIASIQFDHVLIWSLNDLIFEML